MKQLKPLQNAMTRKKLLEKLASDFAAFLNHGEHDSQIDKIKNGKEEKNMKRITSLIAILLAVCMLAACGAQQTAAPSDPAAAGTNANKDRVINVAVSKLIDRFYTPDNFGVTEGIVMQQVYDTLLTQNADGTYGPSLAKDWEVSDDGLTYTFYLRDDVKWQDGEPFTSADVLYTFERYHEAPLFAWLYPVRVDKYIAVDEYTFQIILKEPMASFICNLHTPTVASIMPKHACERWGDEYGKTPDKIVGTGPYIVTEIVPSVSISYKSNPDYFKGVPSIEKICLHQIPDNNAIVIALQAGDIDLSFYGISGSSYDTLKATPNMIIEECPDALYHYINMYCKSGLFSDVRVRQAVAYAVNTEEILLLAQNGRGTLLNYSGDLGTLINANPDVTPAHVYKQDLDKARALIKEAGVEGAKVVISSYNSEPYVTIDTYLQSVLTQIGLDATVLPAERATFIADLDKENVQIYTLGKIDTNFDMEVSFAASVSTAYWGSGGNYSYYQNDEVQDLIERAVRSSDIEERKELYKKAIDIVTEEVPYIPLYALSQTIAHTSDIVTDNPRTNNMFLYSWA